MPNSFLSLSKNKQIALLFFLEWENRLQKSLGGAQIAGQVRFVNKFSVGALHISNVRSLLGDSGDSAG